MYDGGLRCCHRDTECRICSNSLLTLLLFCKLQTILKLKHIWISTRNKQGVKNQLLTLRFPGSFISDLQRGDRERKDGNLRYREGSRALLSSNPCLNPEPDPRAAQKVPSPTHWTRAILSVWLRPQYILCLFLCRNGERRVVVPLCGHRADDWIPELPFDLTRDLPRLSLGSQQWVSAVHTSSCPSSVKFKVWVVFQNTCWHRCFSLH